MNNWMKWFSVATLLVNAPVSLANEFTPGQGFYLNYDWMNKIVNKTPAKRGSCPTLDLDVYGNGFQVAIEKSFWGSLNLSASRWFPNEELWASVGVGPVKNSFGILFGDVSDVSEIEAEKEKKLPKTAEELADWGVKDAAYWESQGGVSFYLGTGISPFHVGAFAVATGGWTNYLQKTGPNKVYVERAKKYIKTISLGAGVSYPNVGHERLYESANGFSYEFTLDTDEAIEAFERFMYGDTTKAQELSAFDGSGVLKIADTSEKRQGFTNFFGIATPYIGLFSFRAARERTVNEFEEISSWDEKVSKNYGIYVSKRNTRLVGLHFRVAKSFVGGTTTKDLPGSEGTRNLSEELYGQFKYSYESDWGQENRLRKYIRRARAATGLVEETCVQVPDFKNSLGYNQVVLEMKMSDGYVRELIGQGKYKGNFLNKIKAIAGGEQKSYFSDNKGVVDLDVCEFEDKDGHEDFDTCKRNTQKDLTKSFAKLEEITNQMKKSYTSDKAAFSKQVAKFGEEVWKSPFVFKAFFEQGKLCGQEFKFEVSGKRITRHMNEQKWNYSEACAQ